MDDTAHNTELKYQLLELNGSQNRMIKEIEQLKSLAEKAFAPSSTLDELTIPNGLYKEYPSYGYFYSYIFVGDSDAGSTLTFGNRIQEHTITLTGGWNQINLFDNSWWKCSKTINVLLLRSKHDMTLPLGLTSTTPVYASIIGNNQTFPTDRFVVNVLNQSALTETTNGNTNTFSVGSLSELSLDINVSAASGTSPTLNFYVDRLGLDGNWYTIFSSAQLTAIGTVSASIGSGLSTNQSFGSDIRIRWAIGGTTPSFTFTISLIGK